MDSKYLNTLSRSTAVFLLTVLLSGILNNGALAAPGDITRISVSSSGVQADNYTKAPAISADGRYVAFRSAASNLISGDTNGTEDVFIHDRQTGGTTRVSVDSSGAEANGYSSNPAVSGDGRYVVFSSFASNLISGDTNGMIDIFVHDRQTGETTRVSVDSSGAEANGESSEYYVSISGDGRYVAFQSDASNLVSDDTNGIADIFVHDRQTGETTRASVDSSGAQANGFSSDPTISGDGRYVAFRSVASDLVSGDTNGVSDVFVHDRQTGQTTRVSVSSGGVQADESCTDPVISSDGRYVAFSSEAETLVPGAEMWASVYVHDRQTGETTRASAWSDGSTMVGTSTAPTLSGDGRFVAFVFDDRSDSEGLTEIYIHDRQAGETIRATLSGTTYEDSSYYPSISSDGSILAFESLSNRLVGRDTNETSDIFIYEVDFEPDLAPTVVSILQDCPRGCISAADPVVDFTVTFSESVTGVTPDDFDLTTTGALSGTSIAETIGTGSEYIVAVNTGSGTGTLRLDVIDNDSILDATDDPLGGIGTGNGNFTNGDVYTVDRSIPIATSVLRADPSPTSAEYVHFSVTFSEEVLGVDGGDFGLTTTGSITGASIAAISGSGATYSLTIQTGSGDGTLRLDILDNDTITDGLGNPLGGEGVGNGNFNSGESYTLDRSAPYVTGSLRADPSPTPADYVTFTVGFSEPVSGVDASDFALNTTGSISGASITVVSGSGNLYTIIAGTGSGEGTLRLDILDNDSIVDGMGNPLGGAGSGNGDFVTGEEYTLTEIPVKKFVEMFRSNGANDGWVLESSEYSGQGGYKDARSTTFVLGDDARNGQFRAILHFPTHYLPNNAVITRVLLMIKGEAMVGSDPFDTNQNIVVDIRSGAFGFIGPFRYRGLQNSDFQSPSSRDAVGVIENNPFNRWYWSYLDSSAFEHINLYGITQIRLRFQVDDNNDFGNDYLRFYSGDHHKLHFRPRLLVEYYRR